ncbi:hypothetical protein B0O99DRAFT_148295 [Bisporella sp. PMI_857]|nr:hypothetical protein B0O99DRAFT_148295 [Bisporella sp. PMI_857]
MKMSQEDRSPSPKFEQSQWETHNLPIVRPLVLRDGRELKLNPEKDSGLRNYRSALVTQRGTLQSAPCSHCRPPNPSGPFQGCIVLESFQKGSCTNCTYSGGGSRCSLRLGCENEDGHQTKRAGYQARKEMRVDRTPKEVIDVEQLENPQPADWFLKRRAATDARNRLSRYSYVVDEPVADRTLVIDGTMHEVSFSPRTQGAERSEHGESSAEISEGTDVRLEPDRNARPTYQGLVEKASPPRGAFTAKRGGLSKASSTRLQQDRPVDPENRKRRGTPEKAEDEVPLAQRRRINPSTDLEHEENKEWPPPKVKLIE